ncbi:MAG: DUF4956 domain-containing protein [Nitrospinota bacterium]|nr:DUF4956 domain-containing protein [Nitrospinota bacterium]MED5352879.1 DUF4956 domain-containing protein [Nitrospinota bacterium]MEE3253051.1 DUF4956 domain-containing protein [Nitrospinota bacterium]
MNPSAIQAVKDLYANIGAPPTLGTFILSGILAFLYGYLLSLVYIRFGRPLSSGKSFGQTFVLVAMTTMFIITVVKSSLALSLGLIGALSIVRFRTPIKEPEELSYLFVAVGIGLGLGANQFLITTVAFLIIIFAIIFLKRGSTNTSYENLYLTARSGEQDESIINKVNETLLQYCDSIQLKRLSTTTTLFEAVYLIGIENTEQLTGLNNELRSIKPDLELSFVDFERGGQ